MSKDKFRDPIHGFIEVREIEKKIINSVAFQRLRHIKQLAFTFMVFHGAEHTRFGHCLGVMHLVSKAFKSAVSNALLNNKVKDIAAEIFTDKKVDWYEQILRLIALTHDIGHAPFSHASESVFPNNLTHEDYTEKILKDTEISHYIKEIGKIYVDKYGKDFDITPELICDIYMGRNPGPNNEFTFLKTFLDSELDCDKMDYLLRDSVYCGVNYGKFDVERLISSLTIFFQGKMPKLAIKHGGVQAFEEFVLARYFMFVQVYFHRTRRFLDILYVNALHKILPDGKFPDKTEDYINWDDDRMMILIKQNADKSEECKAIINRCVYKTIYETKTHPNQSDQQMFNVIKKALLSEIGQEYIISDTAAGKMPHKIPIRTNIDDEKAIVIIKPNDQISTISEESLIIKTLTEKINIERLYINPSKQEDAQKVVDNLIGDTYER